MRRLSAAILSLVLAACGAAPDPTTPALWQAVCTDGRQAWLFGTVHALERPADWRGKTVDKAMAGADLLMVELADPDNATAGAQVWQKLANSPGHGPLSARIAPDQRGKLTTVLKGAGLRDEDFASTETWAAALTVAQASSRQLDSAHGIDRAVLAAMQGKRVEELEGREAQLAIFDRLPESEQRDLLAAIVGDAARGRDESADLAAAWRRGDMDAIARESRRGLLADPELREALYTGRNRRWTGRIVAAMKRGHVPFVAVGAAHLVGPQGVPAMLRERGCAVERVQ